ncbi:phototropic-responsive NPH3 family protein NPY1 [Henckelia pumila]|uniref:phototropic-responsive NPH3 family protein NPY1 n=1 Tax=Henckelia pumila TaxID=405737 RepID=UPI003C6E6DEE
MKYMKLGSKPDAFQAVGNCVRFVSSELETDIVINVGELKFHLHKFPLLSKSNRIQKLLSKSNKEGLDEIELDDFPGGSKAFEICAKFCYGMVVTLNAYNVVAARCAAEYLEMTEDIDRGNLIFKIDVFLNSSIFRSWKDSIIVLQCTDSLLPWSENHKVIGRSIDSIASKTSVDPSLVSWSYTYNRNMSSLDKITQSEIKFPDKTGYTPRDWWVEDVCELNINLFKRVIVAIKLKGRMDGGVICEALRTFATKWLPDSVDALVSSANSHKNKSLLETIIWLLPSDKDVSCSCSFLLKLLKYAVLLNADESLKEDLIISVGLKLDEACISDLLIRARSPQNTIYDIELVQKLVDQFVTNGRSNRNLKVAEKNGRTEGDFVLGHGSWLRVGKIIDSYLAEVARDLNLPVASFIELAQSIPESARPIHDRLYCAIDIYLKEHPSLTKAERKNLCGLMDVKKLTTDTSVHAAQNEQLPLRVVVQVLFFEQTRAAATPRNNRENWTKATPDNSKSLRKQMDDLKVKEEAELVKAGKLTKRSGSKNAGSRVMLLPSRSRRIFDKLWIVGKGLGHGDNKSSETSASSQSPVSMVQGEMIKSSSSSSRRRRYSIS